MQAMTSESDEEIMTCLGSVKNVSRVGLIHESVNVNNWSDYTRKFCFPRSGEMRVQWLI